MDCRLVYTPSASRFDANLRDVLASMRILLIEDESEVARTVDRGLTSQCHQVLVAESGEDGLLLVRTEPVDLVLLDIMLPGQSGIQTLAELRRLRTDLPVIMLTARDETESKIGALDIGA